MPFFASTFIQTALAIPDTLSSASIRSSRALPQGLYSLPSIIAASHCSFGG